MIKINPLTAIDFYKADHKSQYPDGTTLVYSNFTPRSDKLFNALEKYWKGEIIFYGLQGFIKWFLTDTWNTEFFNKPKEEVVSRYKRRMDTSLGPDAINVEHIEALHDLGYLPIKIKALPEGSHVPLKVPVFTIENTLPEFFWLTNYLETVMSAEMWKPCTTATIAFQYRKLLQDYAMETGAPLEFVPLQAHDFSARGLSGLVDGHTSASGHLLSFVGTDTVSAIDYLEDYYNADAEKELIACSVSASEHSTMTILGPDGEFEQIKRLITEVYPSGIASIVIDGFDFWKVITEYTVQMKEEILNRKPNALGLNKVVFRPDSGCPVKILTGYKKPYKVVNYKSRNDALLDAPYELTDCEVVFINGNWYKCYWSSEDDFEINTTRPIPECEVKGAVECLWDIFGGTVTDKGYKVLDEHVGLIYGDSITLERAETILSRLKEKEFASNNIVFGVGSFTYQYNTRDTFGFAMKATYGEVNGEAREIFKDPVTDNGTKKSAKGLLAVIKDVTESQKGVLKLADQVDQEFQDNFCQMSTVFKDGKLLVETSLSEMRRRVEEGL